MPTRKQELEARYIDKDGIVLADKLMIDTIWMLDLVLQELMAEGWNVHLSYKWASDIVRGHLDALISPPEEEEGDE